MWRKLRIALLLFVLATVAHQAWLREQDFDWRHNFYVALHPINADGSPAVERYLATLQQAQFDPLTDYFATEGKRYGLALYHPFEIRLGAPIAQLPPLPPRAASVFESILWSLRFRWWAWRNSPPMPIKPKIRLYLLYHDPARTPALSHSTALNKGRVGIVHVYGATEQAQQNMVVIAHELLHTLGATDKYDPHTNLPLFPVGYAVPDQSPPHPQTHAELMAGRVPVSPTKAEMPADVAATVIGPATAREIGWTR